MFNVSFFIYLIIVYMKIIIEILDGQINQISSAQNPGVSNSGAALPASSTLTYIDTGPAKEMTPVIEDIPLSNGNLSGILKPDINGGAAPKIP
jgi:hypothetical protein